MKLKKGNGGTVLCAGSAAPESSPFSPVAAGNVLSLLAPSGIPAVSRRRRCPDHVLAELLALNEEMIEQLRGERSSLSGTADFIMGTIAQHEKAATLLRAQLTDQAADLG